MGRVVNQARLRRRVEEVTGRTLTGRLRVVTDTSAFMTIGFGDVIRVGGRDFFVYGEESEGRFGLDEQPKLWVKRTWDLGSGERKILKLDFPESFVLTVGGVAIKCVRNPHKEARILDATAGDPSFMHGRSVVDEAGNLVRVLDRIEGTSVYQRVQQMAMPHEAYFHREFPKVFVAVLDAARAIARLHASGEIHGDIRNDHLWLERASGRARWIDFDYAYEWTENPFGVDLYGLGNVLLFTAGMGFVTPASLSERLPPGRAPGVRLDPADFSLFLGHRIMNLGKLFPYIPASLNRVLMRFTQRVEILYADVNEMIADLEGCHGDIGDGEGP